MGEKMKIIMDFVSDWEENVLKDIQELDLTFNKKEERTRTIISYLNFQRKRSKGKKWRVYKSAEFHCPALYLQVLEEIEHLLESGGDIFPYLSTAVSNISYKDMLFNDWGILHLHLGDKPYKKDSRFVNRTGPLLFLLKKNGGAYFIKIYKHKPEPWANKELLQIIQLNWPELLDDYRLSEATSVSPELSARELFEARKAGSFVFVELEDRKGKSTVIAPPFLGIASSGHSNIDVRNYDSIFNFIKSLERWIKKNMPLIKVEMTKRKIIIPEDFRFKLIVGEGPVHTIEKNTGFKVTFPLYS